MSAALTAKQEAFAVAVAKGMNASDAYRACYDAGRMKPEVIHVKASELLSNGKVAVRIAALRAPALARNEASVERTMTEQFRAAYGEPADELTWGAKLKALDMANRIHGLYAADNKQKAANIAIQVVFE